MNAIFHSSVHFRSSRSHNWRFATVMALTLAILLSGLAQRSSAAIIYVTTLKEGIGTGACSLAEAIYASNLQASMAITIPARARCSCSVWEARRSRRRASP
jgi:hypothetical protein